jgi:hypothetical protein
MKAGLRLLGGVYEPDNFSSSAVTGFASGL